jgi:hypothetical protein
MLQNAVYNLKTKDRGNEAQELVRRLKELQEKEDTYFNFTVDEETKLERVFFMLKPMIHNFRKWGNLVEIDSTHKTNR